MVGNAKIRGSGILSLILFLGLSASRCEDEKIPVYQDIIFLLNFEIKPSDSLIKKNDTLWITCQFSDDILDYNSNSSFKIPDFEFQTRIGFFKLIGKDRIFSSQPGAVESFQFISLIGSITNMRSTFADFNSTYASGFYTCRIGVIPKFKGVYSINFLSPDKLDISKNIFFPNTNDKRITIAKYRTIYYVINDGKTNFDLYKKHCIASSEILVTTDMIFYEQKGTFTFRVTD